MDLLEAMEQRHSVRAYDPRPIESDKLAAMQAAVEACNQESGLHLQLVVNEPKAFDSAMSHYGSFSGVTNYIAVVGKKGGDLEEQCGYYGERLVLEAQRVGLNTCWVGLTFKKIPDAFRVEPGEKLVCVIALGYGKTEGRFHRGKLAQDVIKHGSETADWFERGVEAALLAPTAVNQQKFTFVLKDGVVKAKAGMGFFSKVDLGIVKYHFEIGAGKEHVRWG